MPTTPICARDLGELWFSGEGGGNLYDRITRDGRTSLSFYHRENNITLMGCTKEITDAAVKKERWLDWFINHYPGGPDGDIAPLTTPVSYCGLPCPTCDFKESHGCRGCHALGGKPFWGECPVASCSHSRDFSHCGQCPEMPCDQLKEFSYGHGEHMEQPPGKGC